MKHNWRTFGCASWRCHGSGDADRCNGAEEDGLEGEHLHCHQRAIRDRRRPAHLVTKEWGCQAGDYVAAKRCSSFLNAKAIESDNSHCITVVDGQEAETVLGDAPTVYILWSGSYLSSANLRPDSMSKSVRLSSKSRRLGLLNLSLVRCSAGDRNKVMNPVERDFRRISGSTVKPSYEWRRW